MMRRFVLLVLLGSLGGQGAPMIRPSIRIISSELAHRMLSSSVEDGEFPLLDMQPYSVPNTSVPNDDAAPTPVSYPRPPYPATYKPTPYAAPPASASYDVPLLEANLNLTLTDGSSFGLTNSLGIQSYTAPTASAC